MDVRRLLRASSTPAEVAFWEIVRAKRLGGYKFRRQHKFAGFYPDFFCVDVSLVVEIDGSVHDGVEAESADAERTRILEAHGARVIRFRNERVLQHPDSVGAELLCLLESLAHPIADDDKAIGKLPLPTASLRAAVGRGSGGEVGDDDVAVIRETRSRSPARE